ncbi:hypothetical protein ON003_13730 [Janibacter hoylei]|uniref:hypothetical protein n=1 Tax=Janibacter hoylei TaxID=364298 RepID=UPI0022386203|nr:hypothetical protein [Janibacter hoylei]MCW4602552.1 hypothetical protein [Janibacter hoylei]
MQLPQCLSAVCDVPRDPKDEGSTRPALDHVDRVEQLLPGREPLLDCHRHEGGRLRVTHRPVRRPDGRNRGLGPGHASSHPLALDAPDDLVDRHPVDAPDVVTVQRRDVHGVLGPAVQPGGSEGGHPVDLRDGFAGLPHGAPPLRVLVERPRPGPEGLRPQPHPPPGLDVGIGLPAGHPEIAQVPTLDDVAVVRRRHQHPPVHVHRVLASLRHAARVALRQP